MRCFRLALTTFLLLAPLLGCASGGPAWVELKGQRFAVEVADDGPERSRGLMYRDELADGTGMLFLHDIEEPLAYWMKNTRIPLDIFYFDSRRRLVSVSRGVPPCSLGDRCPPYPSTGPALYVLELNAGEASRLGVAAGDELVFGPGIAERGKP
ncbi:MAG TPA: DUF192 domain-containing protein [Arenimonas sp.]|nr:DUF192 domain-containing protein [Arenimonas sp.]HRB10181.1 DUF192 domain-containing protein [Ottowia sp.]